MELLSEIIRGEIVAKMNNMIRVSEVVGTFGEQVTSVKFCDYKWLSMYQGKTFGAYAYGNIAENGSVLITAPTNLNVGDLVPLPLPTFFWGTPMNTVEEWHNFATREEDKLPFIWLVQPTKLKYNDYRQTVKVVADLNLFFVHYSNWKQTNEYRENQSIKPLQAIADEFVATINRNGKWFNKLRQNTRTEHPRFGKESTKGVEETVFRSKLAAVKLVTSLDIKENCKC